MKQTDKRLSKTDKKTHIKSNQHPLRVADLKKSVNHFKNGILKASGDYANPAEEGGSSMQILNSLNESQMSREKFMAIIDAYGGPAKFL